MTDKKSKVQGPKSKAKGRSMFNVQSSMFKTGARDLISKRKAPRRTLDLGPWTLDQVPLVTGCCVTCESISETCSKSNGLPMIPLTRFSFSGAINVPAP